jgi:hypothetical protein
MPDLIPLSRPYAARGGAPIVRAVDGAIFDRTYFARCMDCSWCADWCCSHGVDVDETVAQALIARAGEIEARIGVAVDDWFEGPPESDPDAPGGALRRAAVRDGACVFRSRRGRGCALHALAIEIGEDYHRLKPMASVLFPVTWGEEALLISDELEDGSLACAGEGPSVYDASRGELAWYFGDALVAELDGMRRSLQRGAA